MIDRMREVMRVDALDAIADALYRLITTEQWSDEDRATLIAAHDQIVAISTKIEGPTPESEGANP